MLRHLEYYAYRKRSAGDKSSDVTLSGVTRKHMSKDGPERGKNPAQSDKKLQRSAKQSAEKHAAEKQSSEKQSSEKQSKEWLKDYLKKVYGVSMTGPNSLQQDLHDSGQFGAVQILSDDFFFRILARFNDLDVAPCDGLISISEVHNAIINPRLHFDERDHLMLRILKHYFHAIQELANAEADAGHHHGIRREDLELISSSESERCRAMKSKLAAEFAVKEPAS